MVTISGTINGKSVRFTSISEMRNHSIESTDEINLIVYGRDPTPLCSYDDVKNFKMARYEKYGYPRGYAKHKRGRGSAMR